MAAKKSAQLDLESALAELEALVKTMEAGDLSLDESMKNFERGVELTRFCQAALKDAEQKVDILMQDSSGEKSLEDFS